MSPASAILRALSVGALVTIQVFGAPDTAPPPSNLLPSEPLEDFVVRNQRGDAIDLARLDSQPVPVHRASPIYPLALRQAGLTGEVLIAFIVDSAGSVPDAYVVQSSNPWLNRAAVEAILKWKFRPGIKDGKPVNTRMQVPVHFAIQDELGTRRSDLWQVKRPESWGRLPPEFHWDTAPRPIGTAFAVYPFEELLKGATADFVVALVIDPNGVVVKCDVSKAPSPEFARAVVAMADRFAFEPAKKAGQPCYALLTMRANFSLKSDSTVPVSESAKAICKELKRPNPRIVSLSELDRVPRAVSRPHPHYPLTLALEGPAGETVVEFFIDKNGDVQLPRVVSASRPEFGDAATQAVASWWFEPPLKGGKRVIARVRVAFNFTAPE